MTEIAVSPNALKASLLDVLGADSRVTVDRGEVTLEVQADRYLSAMQVLKSHPTLQFEQLIDLCGVDYQDHAAFADCAGRFAAVIHLLSVSLNQRLRVRVFAVNDDFPSLDSVTFIWASASWYEREAFDLYGIVFEGHNDLRRILTDYGFIGHPFRKDFPLSGHVEMRYDADRKRVVYEPVSIEPREITPRIVRENNYGGLH
jgi:NADH-quinone oxidoreductase subunit C